jgi:hypothetical protein
MAELNSIPRLPVFGWSAFSGARQASAPNLLDRPGLLFTTSGRAAIALALERLGIVAGDAVLVPTYHCPTMVSPIAALGAKPIFFPIGASGGPDVEAIRSLATTRVRAVIAVHYFGIPQPLATLRKWCDDTGVLLIEDCAHSLFGTSDGRNVGQWGDAVIGSLTKFLPVPEGGCLLFNRPVDGSISLRSTGPGERGSGQASISWKWARGTVACRLNGVLRCLFAAKRKLRANGSRVPGRVPDDRFRPRDGLVFDRAGVVRDRLRWHAAGSPDPCRWSEFRQDAATTMRALSRRCQGAGCTIRSSPSCRSQAAVRGAAMGERSGTGLSCPARRRPAGVSLDWLWQGVPQIPHDHGMQWSTHILQLGCHRTSIPKYRSDRRPRPRGRP